MKDSRPDAAPSIPARRWKDGRWEDLEETANEEEQIHIFYEDKRCTLWAWPHRLEELALGHVLLDRLRDAGTDDPIPMERRGHVFVLDSEPGKRALRVHLDTPAATGEIAPSAPLAPGALLAHMDAFMAAPGMWDGTGCFHRAGMLHLPTGRLTALVEDIGRHNCLDRLAGCCALQGLRPAEHALLLSARITGSLYCKARRAGFSLLISRAAVTAAAWRRALARSVTLVGFCRPRERRLTIFADTKGRILS